MSLPLPRIRITGLSLRRTLLAASEPGGAFLTADLAFADDASGFDFAAATYTSVGSGQQITLRFSRYGSSFRGGMVTGVVSSSAPLHPLAASGAWLLTSLLVVDWGGTTLDHAASDADWLPVLAAAGITATRFQVENPTPDLTPPTLLDLTFAGRLLDLSNPGGALLSGSLTAVDQGSGVASIELEFVGRLGAADAGFTATIGVDRAWRTSGSALRGTWRWTSDVFAAGPLGVKTLRAVSISDRAGNRWSIDSSSADWGPWLQRVGLGTPVIDVRGTLSPPPADIDRTAPELTGFELLSTVVGPSLEGGDVLTASLAFTDAGAGFSSAVARFVAVEGDASLDVIFSRAHGVLSGTWNRGTITSSTPLDPHLATGAWRLTALTLTDAAGNTRQQVPPALAFSVIDADADRVAPLLTGFSLTTPRLDALQTGGAILFGTLGFVDDRSGLADAIVQFTSADASLPALSLVFAVAEGSFAGAVETGSALGGVLSASTVLGPETAAGTYTLSSIAWHDRAGNGDRRSATDADWSAVLAAAGIVGTIEVIVVNATRNGLSLVNGLELFSDSAGRYAVADGAGPAHLIGFGAGPEPQSVTASTFSGWQLLAAARSEGGIQLLWRQTATGLLLPWVLDDDGRQIGDRGMIAATSAGALQLESTFQIDLDANGSIGSSDVELARVGGAGLLRRGGTGRLAVRDGTGAGGARPVDLSWGGRPLQVDDPRLPGWTAQAVTVSAGDTTVLWRQPATGLVTTWTFAAGGAAMGGRAPVAADGPEARELERRFGVDLNGDHLLGEGAFLVARTDTLELLRRSGTDQLLVRGGDGVIASPLWGGEALGTTDPRLPGWTVLAAAAIDNVNTLLWRHGPSGSLTTWTFDDRWAASGSSPVVSSDSAKALSLESLFQRDANGDGCIGTGWVPMAVAGPVTLLRQNGSGALAASVNGDLPQALRWDGTVLQAQDPRLPGWDAVAAARVGDSNRLLWRHRASGLLASWSFDDSWAASAAAAPVAFQSSAAHALERAFVSDANGDGCIGSPLGRRVTLAVVGSLELQRSTSDGALWLTTVSLLPNDVRLLLELTWNGSPLRHQDPRLPGWTALAATAIEDTVQLVWRHAPSGQLATWSFDANLAASGGTTPVAADSAEAHGLETLFGFDANGDGSIGSPWSTIARVDGQQLLRQSGSGRLAVATAGGSPIPLLWGGQPLLQADQRLPGWLPLAAAALAEGNTLLWRHGPSGQLATWSFDEFWNPIGGAAPVGGDSAAAQSLESRFRIDANGDGCIGSPWLAIAGATASEVTLWRHGVSQQLAVADPGVEPVPLRWGDRPLLATDPRLPGWTLLAAVATAAENRLLWRHDPSGQLASWSCDRSWTPTMGTAPMPGSSPAALDLEDAFGIDANGDGAIGATGSPIEGLRSRIVAAVPDANARDPFTWVQSGGAGVDRLQASPLGNRLLSVVDLITGLPGDAGCIDVIEAGAFSGASTLLLTSASAVAPAADGDNGYTLIRGYRAATDDLVVAGPLALTVEQRTVAGPDGTAVTGLGLHVDSNSNGVFDAGDNLIALLEGISTLPSRLVKI
jgi:hypothetical protein